KPQQSPTSQQVPRTASSVAAGGILLDRQSSGNSCTPKGLKRSLTPLARLAFEPNCTACTRQGRGSAVVENRSFYFIDFNPLERNGAEANNLCSSLTKTIFLGGSCGRKKRQRGVVNFNRQALCAFNSAPCNVFDYTLGPTH